MPLAAREMIRLLLRTDSIAAATLLRTSCGVPDASTFARRDIPSSVTALFVNCFISVRLCWKLKLKRFTPISARCGAQHQAAGVVMKELHARRKRIEDCASDRAWPSL